MINTYAEINLKNLLFNFNSIRKKTKTKIMAVVKADAYGHGMVECANFLSKQKIKPDYYGVALLEEGIELRSKTKITEPILCFAPFDEINLKLYSKYNILPTITTSKHIELLNKYNSRKKIKVHVKINTGMNRLGLNHENAVKQIALLSQNNNVFIDGIYTHFATSDEKDKGYAELQFKRFADIINQLKQIDIQYGLAHCANSGAILDMPQTYLNMVRAGISLYGYYPSLNTSESIKLKPVMSLISKISTISDINKNEPVGYGRLYKTKKIIKCGTVPIGYADGLLRGLSNKINVIIGNSKYPQIGRVSMDRISINLDNSKVREGQKVILIGKSGKKIIDAWDWSKILNTIPYEITCGISKRVTRKYVEISK